MFTLKFIETNHLHDSLGSPARPVPHKVSPLRPRLLPLSAVTLICIYVLLRRLSACCLSHKADQKNSPGERVSGSQANACMGTPWASCDLASPGDSWLGFDLQPDLPIKPPNELGKVCFWSQKKLEGKCWT